MNYLGKTEGKQIVRLLSGLFTYANLKDGLRLKSFDDTTSYLLKGAVKVFKDAQSSEAYIEEYLQATPSIKFRDQKILRQWKGCYKQELYLFGSCEQYSFAYVPKEHQVYGIKGLTDSLEVTLGDRPYPVQVHYAILPYQDFFICDVLDKSNQPMDIPEAVALYEAFRDAGQQQGIRLSLERHTKLDFTDREHGLQDDIFNDFLQPFLLAAHHQLKLVRTVLTSGAYAWEASFKSEDEIATSLYEAKQKGMDVAFIKLCIDRRKTAFPKAEFHIQEFTSYVEHGIVKVHINAGKPSEEGRNEG